MSGKTLLDIAKVNLKAAEIMLERKTDDELLINMVAYHLQQASELAIQHVLELNGIRYPKTHDIGELLELLPDSVACFDAMYPFADTITAMESKTRYIKNYLSSEKKVALVFSVVSDTISKIDLDATATQPLSLNEVDVFK